MRTLYRFVLALVIIAAATFAIANREMVTVNLWPLPFTLNVPLFVAILGAFGVGLIIGSALMGWTRQRLRVRAYVAERKADRLERSAAEKRAAANEDTPPSLPSSRALSRSA
jgi:putative membrane protein